MALRHRFRSATVEDVLATPADRTFTTAKRVGGRLLVVDSKFGFPPAAVVAEDRIVSNRRVLTPPAQPRGSRFSRR